MKKLRCFGKNTSSLDNELSGQEWMINFSIGQMLYALYSILTFNIGIFHVLHNKVLLLRERRSEHGTRNLEQRILRTV